MKQIRLNAFEMACVGHQNPGLWRHPRDRAREYTSMNYWAELARTLERGLFDGVFLADVLGTYDVYGGKPDAAIASALQIPLNDPMMVVPVMAQVTQHLGFGVTANLSYEHPYTFARRMTTLDHLTEGRVGWNIVTGYLNSAAKASGQAQQKNHDDRYAIAEEYMEVVYRLWEESWEEDAILRDAETGMYTDPAKVHVIDHDGAFFRVKGAHLSEPSPQRTPVLYQAGTSKKGVDFAAHHAECVFVTGPTKSYIAKSVKAVRDRAREIGRDPASILFFMLITVVPGVDDATAQAKYAEYSRYISPEGALAMVSGWTGIDLSKLGLDEPILYTRNEAVHSAIESITIADPEKTWTPRDLAQYAGIGGISPVIVGSAKTVADELTAWIEDTDIDGFNLAYALGPESMTDFVNLVVPELQRRGVYKTAYGEGGLRQKLFGAPRLVAPHPAAGYRR